MADKVLGDLHAKAEGKNVMLANELPPLPMRADANRLDQVFANLVDNAIKYGRPNGKVTVGGRKLDDGRAGDFRAGRRAGHSAGIAGPRV